MDSFVDIGNIAEVPVGRTKAYVVGGRSIALYHTARGFFATDNTCPHRGGPLAEGDLIGDEITCPWHLWGFDVASGVCTGNAEVSVAAHEVRVEGERIMVRLS
ncbi:MAG: Rieske 2Fe-2S domain-containing protein [Acidobacteria bacterium]|nr:Rieske 2Fe-2S domain-containing protein [Acidobacteriota bacterium]MBV9478274.1 Rieske 2Fe-2S domain-containing protein [Acidobacteriota bacterium]